MSTTKPTNGELLARIDERTRDLDRRIGRMEIVIVSFLIACFIIVAKVILDTSNLPSPGL